MPYKFLSNQTTANDYTHSANENLEIKPNNIM